MGKLIVILRRFIAALALLLTVAIVALAVVVSYDAPCRTASTPLKQSDLMKAIVYRCYGTSEVLDFEDIVKPSVSADEVLVKVHAASVNPLDWHYMRGTPYIMRLESGIGTPKEMRLGVDFAGTVEAIGEDVTRFKPGDEVFGAAAGAFAEYVTVRHDRAIVHKPVNVNFEQAASVPVAATTALQGLRDKGQIKPGQTVLINGASGGVGTFAVQIAKSFGAEVTGVCSTRNVALVRAIGADHVIDYTEEDFTTSGRRYDLILDNVGNRALSDIRRVLEPDGILVIVGASKGNWVSPFANWIKALVLSPFVSESLVPLLAVLNQKDLGTLAELMQYEKVTPVLDRRYGLNEVSAAIQYSETGRARGKIVIEID